MDMNVPELSPEGYEYSTHLASNTETRMISRSNISEIEQSDLQNQFNVSRITQNSESPLVNHSDVLLHGDVYSECTFRLTKNVYLQQSSTSLPSKVYTHTSQVSETSLELTSKLKERYKQTTLPTVHWLNEGADLVLKDYYVELEQTDSTNPHTKKRIKLKELFQKIDGEIPKRIFVEGQPGIGKTTFATKITHDWATEQPYLKRFRLLFFIPLRHLKGRSIETAINEICKYCDFHNKLDLCEGSLLKGMCLVLDGFDELHESCRKDVLEVLYKVKLSALTVLVTCRSGLFPSNCAELKNIFQQGLFPSLKKVFFDKKITILGIEENNREQFLSKYCNPDAMQKVMNTFKTPSNFNTMDILRIPLVLMMIAYISNKRIMMDLTLTLTELYKLLFNSIIKCTLTKDEKLSVSDDQKFDLFDVNDETSKHYQRKLEEFGDLCLRQLIDQKYSFGFNELSNEIYSMGLLTKDKAINPFANESHFECFHSTIMEFCAAYSLWRQMRIKGMELEIHLRKFEQLSELMELMIGKSPESSFSPIDATKIERTNGFVNTPAIFIFLSGLFQNEIHHFLSLLHSVNPGCDSYEVYLWRMLAEINGSDSETLTLAKEFSTFDSVLFDPVKIRPYIYIIRSPFLMQVALNAMERGVIFYFQKLILFVCIVVILFGLALFLTDTIFELLCVLVYQVVKNLCIWMKGNLFLDLIAFVFFKTETYTRGDVKVGLAQLERPALKLFVIGNYIILYLVIAHTFLTFRYLLRFLFSGEEHVGICVICEDLADWLHFFSISYCANYNCQFGWWLWLYCIQIIDIVSSASLYCCWVAFFFSWICLVFERIKTTFFINWSKEKRM